MIIDRTARSILTVLPQISYHSPDYIILPHLLEICSRKSNHENPFATIVTETHNWTRDFCPEASFGNTMQMSPKMFAQCFQLEKTALEDTNNPRQVHGGNALREYLDNSAEFIDFIDFD